MSMPLTLDRPLWLLALPVLWGALWALTRHSRAGLPPAAQSLALGLRALVVFLLVFALAGPHWVKRSNTLTTLFLLDVSRSVRPDQRASGISYIQKALNGKGAKDEAGLIVFGRAPSLDTLPSDAVQEIGQLRGTVASDATDLAGALRLAAGAFPNDTGRKIVLLSDGNENMGSAANEVAALRAEGVRVDIAPTALGTNGTPSPEALIDSVNLPARARASAPFPLRVTVSSTVPQTATLTVQRDGATIGQERVSLRAGKTAFTYSQTVAAAGFHRYDVSLAPAQDGATENNQGYGFVSVQGKPRVLYVSEPNAPSPPTLPSALAGQEFDVQSAAPGAVPASVSELASYDAVVLSDVPADELSPAQQSALQLAVRDFGVGLGMVGGASSFGAGGWAGTPIEAALPVSMTLPPQRRLPQAAVVVVLDASGSMASTEGGVEKVQLGARAAVQLMEALQPGDQVAVTAVTETSTLVVPLQDASKAGAAHTAIESVHAGGGGIYCRVGLEDAYALLLASHAPIKHVILCADTSDSEQQEDCAAMASEMRLQHHISTTVCGIGNEGDQHVPFQRTVAKAGGGQLFVVHEAGGLPRLFQRDMQTVQQAWYKETPFLPRMEAGDPITVGVPFGAEPPLLGYNVTTLKPGAAPSLSGPGNDPVLASWRCGLGRTWAFTGDDRAHWASQWLGWAAYPRFWAQTTRWALRSNAHADFQASTDWQDGRGHLIVDGAGANGYAARVVAPDLSETTVPLTQTGPGRWEGAFDAAQTGAYMASVTEAPPAPNNGGARGTERPSPSLHPIMGAGGPSAQTVGLVVPYSPEYRTLGPNLPLLTQLAEETGGVMQNNPERVFRDAPSWVVGTLALSPALLLLTALLFVGDIAARRLSLSPKAVRAGAARGVNTVRARTQARAFAWKAAVGASPSPPVPPAQTQTLLARRVSARAPAPETPETVLGRRAVRDMADDDNPFPYVASLREREARKNEAPPPP